MKIVVVSDLHGDRETIGEPRLPDVEQALHQAMRHAIDVRASAFVCLGDIGDPESGGALFKTQRMLAEVAISLAQMRIDVVLIAGNHDVCEDGSGATVLAPLAPLEEMDSLIRVVEAPQVIELSTTIALLCLPFTPAVRPYDPAAFAREHWPERHRVIVAGHLMVPGVVPGEETLEMPRGREVVFPVAETERAILRLNGHYHKAQTTKEGIVIPGSLVRLTFGEESNEPRFLEIDAS